MCRPNAPYARYVESLQQSYGWDRLTRAVVCYQLPQACSSIVRRFGRMSNETCDPYHFFDRFPRFADTSETGKYLHGQELLRLNARYYALIECNRDLIERASVLDLASHDGRYTFAALQNGAEHVIGIELKPRIARAAQDNMRAYGVPASKYNFIVGNMFDVIQEIRPGACDVVFCFGILYHVTDPMGLLSLIAELEPRWLILDTSITLAEGAVIELRNADVEPGGRAHPPPPGSQLEGYPSKAGLEAMLSSLGWTLEYFDWTASGLVEPNPEERELGAMFDYRTGRRVSAVVNCGERYPRELRERAVQTIFDRYPITTEPIRYISEVASEVGMSTQALSVWVRKAEREANQERRRAAIERYRRIHLDGQQTQLETNT